MKIIIFESQYNKTIDRLISYYLVPHENKKMKNFYDSIFWVKDGEIVAEIETYDEKIYINGRTIGQSISQMLGISNEEMEDHLRSWFDKRGLSEFKLNVSDLNGLRWSFARNY